MPLMLFFWKLFCGSYVCFGSVLHIAKDMGEGGEKY